MGKKKSGKNKKESKSPNKDAKPETLPWQPSWSLIFMTISILVSFLAGNEDVYLYLTKLVGINISGGRSKFVKLEELAWVREAGYDENGYLVGRAHSNLTLMPVSMKESHFVANPEELSPYIKYLPGPKQSERQERAMGVRFRSFVPYDLEIYWDNGKPEGVYSGVIKPYKDSPTNSYTTHKFMFRNPRTKKNVQVIEIVEGKHFYFVGPLEGDDAQYNTKFYADSMKEKKFLEDYYTEHGYPWLSYYPRGAPHLFIYPADFVGQTHSVTSNIGYFHLSKSGKPFQSPKPIELNLVVASTSPKVFIIQNLLSEFEIDHIISLGIDKVKQSKVGSSSGGFQSATRTSENGWLSRKESDVLNILYLRFGDMLRMTDEQLKDDTNACAENLQFVRYLETQKYEAHHDFGNSGRMEQRFSTALIYLEVPEEGGGTSFPKAFDGQGIQVKPKRGDAVLFYNMLADGNGDDFSLHSGMPVIKGTKYICNLWSWDPKRYF